MVAVEAGAERRCPPTARRCFAARMSPGAARACLAYATVPARHHAFIVCHASQTNVLLFTYVHDAHARTARLRKGARVASHGECSARGNRQAVESRVARRRR